ncbi:MAG: hypothetical protein U5N55_11285 [Cypionkella sp.]|nr:hypothetical protein [Cypionkella sp.]
MQRLILALGAIAAGIAAIWALDGFSAFAAWVLDSQREVQTWLAGAIRSLRAGEAGALSAFLTICFGYGVLHAAGPGHGKLVIGGYGVARRVTARRLALLSLVSSLAQAAAAVVAVYAIVAVLGLSRQVAGDVVDGIMAPVGSAAIAALGLYLLWRGAKGLRIQRAALAHDHHNHGPPTALQANAHGPSVGAGAVRAHSPRVRSWPSSQALKRCGPARGRCLC